MQLSEPRYWCEEAEGHLEGMDGGADMGVCGSRRIRADDRLGFQEFSCKPSLGGFFLYQVAGAQGAEHHLVGLGTNGNVCACG